MNWILPYAPCIGYLPTCTPKITQIIPYVEHLEMLCIIMSLVSVISGRLFHTFPPANTRPSQTSIWKTTIPLKSGNSQGGPASWGIVNCHITLWADSNPQSSPSLARNNSQHPIKIHKSTKHQPNSSNFGPRFTPHSLPFQKKGTHNYVSMTQSK